MRLPSAVLCIALIILLPSCNRLTQKGKKAVTQAKNEIREQKENLVDKAFPTFDSYHPDTKFNKLRFKEFFGFTPTPDVSEIYCFGDMMGIDSKFQFAFNCDTTTRNRIVTHLNLKRDTVAGNFGSGLWQPFIWWDSAAIVSILPYRRKGAHELYQYFWFDSVKNKAYYQEFDL